MSKLKNFAHLLGRSARASEDDDEKESRKAKSGRAEDDEKDESSAEDEKDKSAEEDNEEKNAGEGDDDNNDDDENASEDDGDEKESPSVKKGRRAERARCAAIFACREASFRPDMAAHLAFNTSMSAREAVSLMKTIGTQGARRGDSLASRMAGEPDYRAGQDSSRHQQGASSEMAGLLNAYNTIKGVKK
ncbi:hypothetical protein LB105_000838 [Salmonella enterica]|uniref:Prophage protein n=2 Tax=Salmonella enterica TaxID=28901 RepID=A0A765C0R9_SALER|nr:hypothetical protein [Salmonella enterica]EBS4088441.1 hypothetical protein [Salmonella enterica subsp. enterica serovar Newport]ECC9078361.1 hypothetical protein [Salmonella enterica subsp. enterica]ECD7244647.1 hypothetical protein [Salmonella enterica subsp. enterica serovar Florida]ASD87095.1 hypothetical protein LFZ16_13015 [Salmonella enterica subsp. enterica serovar India str. SA20085604]EAO5288378.1 hypothetical protein [Salmonella enterica]